MIRRVLFLSVLMSMIFSTGCMAPLGLLQGMLPSGLIPTAISNANPTPAGEEISMLYARGVRSMMPDPIKDLKIAPNERVWVVNKNGGTNNDGPVDALTYDAVIDVLRGRGIAEVAARDDDMLRSLYVEYTESGKLAARADSLAREGKIQPADVILTYRLMRLNTRQPGTIILLFRYIVGGCMGLVTDAQPNNTDGIRLMLHVEAIDVKTGTTRATRVVEHVEDQPEWFNTDYLFEGKR